MEVIDHIIEIKETLGGLVEETRGLKEQVKFANGRTGTLEIRVSTLEEINAEKRGGTDTWKYVAGGLGAIFLVVLGAAISSLLS